MTKESFIDTLLGACGNAPPMVIDNVRALATLAYNPTLDDDEQIRQVVRIAYRSAEDLKVAAMHLEASLKKALPTIWRDRE